MRTYTKALNIMIILLLFIASGCQTVQKVDQKTKFDAALRDYMQSLRWQDFYGAAAFMVEENRAAFLEDVTGNEALNITDLTLLNLEPTNNPDEYQTLIRLEYFMLPSTTVKKKEIHQTWILVLDPSSVKPKGWQIATPFPEFP